jgi:hypothetical protein
VADGIVRIPLLPNPNARRWYAGTCLVTLAVLGYLVITEPANLPWLGPAVAVLLAPVLLATTRTLWLDPASGTVGLTSLWFWRVCVTPAPQVPIALVDSGNGCLQLGLGRFPRRVFVPLLRLDVYDHTSQEPGVLRLLADVLARRVPAKQHVADRLRRQADHVEAGGPLDSSPLAALLVAHTVMPLPGRTRHHG